MNGHTPLKIDSFIYSESFSLLASERKSRIKSKPVHNSWRSGLIKSNAKSQSKGFTEWNVNHQPSAREKQRETAVLILYY